MELNKLSKLTFEKKKEILSDLIENDVSYWKKIFVLMSMVDENQDTELLDLIIEHKIEEIKLANKKYNISIKHNDICDSDKKSYTEKVDTNFNFSRACKEVLEILNNIPKEYYNKINKNFIEKLEKNAEKSYTLPITNDTNYKDLNLLRETKEMLFLISNKFWNVKGNNIEIVEIFNK